MQSPRARGGHGNPDRTFRPVYNLRLRQIDIEDLAIQKENIYGCLLVDGVLLHPPRGEIGRGGLNLRRHPSQEGAEGSVEANKAPDPGAMTSLAVGYSGSTDCAGAASRTAAQMQLRTPVSISWSMLYA